MRHTLLAFLLLLTVQHAYAAQEDTLYSLKTASGKVYGTLTVPGIKGRSAMRSMPLVLIIPGSGGADRNGNMGIMTNNALKMLSDSLQAHGIASLRIDRRGIGASKKVTDEAKLTFGDYVTDLRGWIGKLRKDRRFSRIYLAGHNDGALMALLAAREGGVSGVISLEGQGLPADTFVIDQLRMLPQLPPSALDSAKMYFSILKETGRLEAVPRGFYESMFRPSVQRYLLSWMKYDPREAIRQIRVPVILIHGASDMQIDTAQAYGLAAAKPDAQLLIIPDMNHVFKEVSRDDPTRNMGAFYDPTLPLKPELVQAIVRFVLQQ